MKDKSIEEMIRDEAEEKYPVFSGFTSRGLPHEIYTGQKYKREGYIAGRSKSIESEKQKDERIRENAIGFAHWKDRHFKRTYPLTGYFYCLENYESIKLIPGVLYGEHYSFEQLYDMYVESQK